MSTPANEESTSVSAETAPAAEETSQSGFSKESVEEASKLLQEALRKALDKEMAIERELAEFSDGFAGIAYALMQMVHAGDISHFRARDLISLFYHFDTGKFLHPTKLQDLLLHDKCMKYAKSVEENAMAYNRRVEKFKTNESLDDLAEFVRAEAAKEENENKKTVTADAPVENQAPE
jgi:hypothetical protein